MAQWCTCKDLARKIATLVVARRSGLDHDLSAAHGCCAVVDDGRGRNPDLYYVLVHRRCRKQTTSVLAYAALFLFLLVFGRIRSLSDLLCQSSVRHGIPHPSEPGGKRHRSGQGICAVSPGRSLSACWIRLYRFIAQEGWS